MTSRDIALEMLVTRALDEDDQKLLALMNKRVGVALRMQRLNGAVRSWRPNQVAVVQAPMNARMRPSSASTAGTLSGCRARWKRC
jgi:hypothetical protein